jgi:predicted MPP superfamily phosphohydrolase
MSLRRLLVVLPIALSILFGAHYYVWARLVRDTRLPAPYGEALTAAIAALGIAIVFVLLTRRRELRWLAGLKWVVYSWLGVGFFLVVLLAAADLVRPFLASGSELALARAVGATVGAAALVLAGSGVLSVLRPAAIKRVRVPLRRLSPKLDGYTIAQISDVHVGPTIGRAFVESLVARVNAIGADMIAITGDLVDGSVAELGALVAPLGGLRAKDGVYFVTGNHEYYSGASEWCAFLESIGIRVLRNERAPLREGLEVAGVDDWSARRFGGSGADLERALGGRDESNAVVLLAHQPKAIEEAERLGVDLQLSGHTHGGQLVPWNFLVKLQQPYVSGLHAHGRTQIYVSNGTGYWGPPMRVGAPAEITRIELAVVS